MIHSYHPLFQVSSWPFFSKKGKDQGERGAVALCLGLFHFFSFFFKSCRSDTFFDVAQAGVRISKYLYAVAASSNSPQSE